MKLINLTGQTFGKLTVLRRVGYKWECICECGNITFDSTAHIKNIRRSCGCLRKFSKTVASFNDLYNRYKYRAEKVLKIEFSLTKDDFKTLTQRRCFYCNVEPKQQAKFKNGPRKKYNGVYIYNGIDRINNNNGYSLENSRTCCGICNKAKRDMSEKSFETWINQLTYYRMITIFKKVYLKNE